MRAKIGYMAILVLMGFLYLWTNVAVTFYLFFGILLFAIGYAFLPFAAPSSFAAFAISSSTMVFVARGRK